MIDTLNLVCLNAGGWRIGIEARHVLGSRAATPGATAVAVETLLGMPVQETVCATSRLLTLRLLEGECEILVNGDIDLHSLSADRIHDLPPLLAARNRLHGLRALVPDTSGSFLLLFDLSVLSNQTYT